MYNQPINSLIIEIVVFIVIMFLVLTDKRFSKNRKFMFLGLCLILFIISFFIDKVPFLIIKDLFGYSLVLNISFIIHVLVLNRMFEYSGKNHYEYVGFLISRTSYAISLGGLIYLVIKIYEKIQLLSSNYSDLNGISGGYNRGPKLTNNQLGFFNNIYIKYIKNFTIFNFIYSLFINIIIYSKGIIMSILIHFSIVFHNYSLILLGKNKSLDIKNIENIVIIFVFLFSISMGVGIPRLYVIGILQLVIEIYKILTFKYLFGHTWSEKGTIKRGLKYFFRYGPDRILEPMYENKYYTLMHIYKEVYNPLFMFDLYKFLYNKYKFGESAGIGYHGGPLYEKFDESINYPIRKVYKYYPGEEMAKGYIKVGYKLMTNENYNEGLDYLDPHEELIAHSIQGMEKINIKDFEMRKKFLSEIIIGSDSNGSEESGFYSYVLNMIELYDLRKNND